MSELKTKRNKKSVTDFLNKVDDPKKKEDCMAILKLMKEVSGEKPEMWGDSIVGFGSYHYKYASGREGDWMIIGFSPRKQNLSVYIMDDLSKYDKFLQKLGKFKTGKSCLYIKKLGDVDQKVLKEMIVESVKKIKEAEKKMSRS